MAINEVSLVHHFRTSFVFQNYGDLTQPSTLSETKNEYRPK